MFHSNKIHSFIESEALVLRGNSFGEKQFGDVQKMVEKPF